MKKLLSLLLALSLAFSCFGVMSFAEEDDDYYDTRPECVAKVIDPIINEINTEFADSINKIGYSSVDEVAKTGNITDFDSFIEENKSDLMFGVSMEELYGEVREPFAWSNFKVPLVFTDDHGNLPCKFKEMYDECAEVLLGNRVEYEGKAADVALFEKISEVKVTVGQKVNHYNYFFLLGKGEISLVRANTNLYLKRVISNYWGGGRFYTNENIVAITNFIGTLINPHFILLPDGYRPIDDNVSMDAYTFFGKIVELSGLGSIIDSNWCRQSGMNFIPLMAAFGVNTDTLLTGEKTEGYYVGRRLLTDMFSEFFSSPLTYILNVVWAFAKEYSNTYKDAFRALFSVRYAQVGDQYTEEELSTVTGAFNFISDSVDSVMNKINGSALYDNLAFGTLPATKFASAVDHDELFLMVLCYLDINRMYKAPDEEIDINKDGVISNSEIFRRTENEIVLENIWINFNKAAGDTLTADEMTTIKSFYDNFVMGELTMKSFLKDMLNDVTNTNMGQIENDFMNSIKVSIANLFKKIVDAIDNFVRIILGEKDPFERI
ncbi:MAG: hypothetical protein IJW86_00205 [Clostridia bacterium]|nr:hypothetical protein [Clostridia bacterium]